MADSKAVRLADRKAVYLAFLMVEMSVDMLVAPTAALKVDCWVDHSAVWKVDCWAALRAAQ